MQKFIQTIEKVRELMRLSENERANMRALLLNHINTPITSPFSYPSKIRSHRWILAHHRFFIRGVAVILIVLLIGGTGLASASEQALPGDALYTAKLAFETIKSNLKPTPAAKVSYEITLTDKRFDEAKELSSQGKLTTETSVIIAQKINEHTSRATTTANKVAFSDPEQHMEALKAIKDELITGSQEISSTIVEQTEKAEVTSSDSVIDETTPIEQTTDEGTTNDPGNNNVDDIIKTDMTIAEANQIIEETLGVVLATAKENIKEVTKIENTVNQINTLIAETNDNPQKNDGDTSSENINGAGQVNDSTNSITIPISSVATSISSETTSFITNDVYIKNSIDQFQNEITFLHTLVPKNVQIVVPTPQPVQVIQEPTILLNKTLLQVPTMYDATSEVTALPSVPTDTDIAVAPVSLPAGGDISKLEVIKLPFDISSSNTIETTASADKLMRDIDTSFSLLQSAYDANNIIAVQALMEKTDTLIGQIYIILSRERYHVTTQQALSQSTQPSVQTKQVNQIESTITIPSPSSVL